MKSLNWVAAASDRMIMITNIAIVTESYQNHINSTFQLIGMCSTITSDPAGVVQLTSELEALQQQLFQQKQQVISLTAHNKSMQAELESSQSRLQGEAERAASHQQQLDAERKLRILRSEEVRCAVLCCDCVVCLCAWTARILT